MLKSSFKNLDWDISDKFMICPTLQNAESASPVLSALIYNLLLYFRYDVSTIWSPLDPHVENDQIIMIYPIYSKVKSSRLTSEHLHTNKVTMSNKNQEIQRGEKAPRQYREIKQPQMLGIVLIENILRERQSPIKRRIKFQTAATI